jgi:signal transduction histidine kinase
VQWLRRPLRRRLGRTDADVGDLGALAAVDLLFCALVLYLSGGFNTPYYHFTVMALLVPAFLFGWVGTLGTLAAFGLGMVLIWSLSGGGLEGWTRLEQLGGAVPGLLLTPLLVVTVAQYMARLTRRLHEAAEERERLVAQEERSRIAGEIHDGVAQFLYILQMGLDRLARRPADASTGAQLQDLARLAQQALVEVRQYIFDLQPLLDQTASLEETLRRQAREFSAVADIPLTVTVDGEEPPLSTPVRGALFRVTQEALANVYRHADANRISVIVRAEPSALTVEVSDDGAGFGDDSSSSGRGIRNMRRRLSEVGGSLEIRSTPGQGTTVRASVPVGP